VIRGRITDAVTNERVASADNVDDIPISDIHGIEVYSGPATVPVEYRNSLPNGFCGLVMIWTRHGSADIVRRRDN